jgi:enamine deaminase RidA (YjgF/YER057c/UK114 family)
VIAGENNCSDAGGLDDRPTICPMNAHGSQTIRDLARSRTAKFARPVLLHRPNRGASLSKFRRIGSKDAAHRTATRGNLGVRRPLRFSSASGRGTLDRSSISGRPVMAISRFDLTQPPGPRMSRCVVRDNTVYLAGLTASDTTQDIEGQTKQILDKIDGYLAQAGTSKSNLLSANLWIKDMAQFADMNSVWNAWVDPENPPARACVRADLARPEVLVEIMVTAAK